MPKVIFIVTNDLVSDQRVHRIASTLLKTGFEVLLVGRLLKTSEPVNRAYQTRRFKLWFNKSWLFYANYNIRIFFFLLFLKNYDVVVCNDLDTLAAGTVAAKIRCKRIVYDAHEYFTEVPELVNRPFIKSIWLFFEKFLVPMVDSAYTVCESLADIYSKNYQKQFRIVRNLPFQQTIQKTDTLKKMYPGKKIIIYQGAVNMGRGLELMLDVMKLIDNAVFIIIGDGDIKTELEQKIVSENLKNKVFLSGRIPFALLPEYTNSADAGISLEEDLGLNYRYALPNKLFDYIQAKVPVLVSDLPEMKKIVEKYGVGFIVKERNPAAIAKTIQEMMDNNELINGLKNKLLAASSELCWENEEKKIIEIYREFL